MKFILGALLFVAHLGVAQAATVQPFELRWMNHEDRSTMYKSTDHPNGVFVIETYFLNCPYCNQNAHNVDALAEAYQNEPRVQVLDVSRDCRESDYDTWIDKHAPNHPVLNDCSKRVLSALGTRSYPTAYVLDCKGNVVYQTTGTWSATVAATIRAKVDSLLQQDCAAE